MLILLGCTTPAPRERVEPSFIEVTLGDFAAGTETEPLPFSGDPVSVPLSVRTLGADGSPHAFSGELTVRVRPGVAETETVSVSDGAWSGEVSIRNAFGRSRIWLADEGEGRSWSVGVTDTLWYARPTISEMQTTDDPETNPLAGEFVNLRVEDRQVVVTARDAAGFWATDIADPVGSYNSVYVYTFSRPEDTYAVGARIALLSGIDQEYLGSTQLSYPTLEAAGETLAVPDAAELSSCEDVALEPYEASAVRVSGGLVPDTFVPGSVDYSDYETYGQWPIQFGDCTVYVESGGTAPDFAPGDYAGQTLPEVRGMLKQIFSKWILVVVDADDLVTVAR